MNTAAATAPLANGGHAAVRPAARSPEVIATPAGGAHFAEPPFDAGIEQRVELRRANARELHTLAGLAGEGRLSAALQKGVTEMLQAFLQRARTRLEK